MKNEKVSKKIKSSYLVIAILPKSIPILKRTKCKTAQPGTQIGVRCM